MDTGIPEKVRQQLTPLVDALGGIGSVRAITLSGSTTSGLNDHFSDYDTYVYTRVPINVGLRREIAAKLSIRHEVDQKFFEDCDDWILPDSNVLVEIIYRSPEWIEEQVERVWVRGEASVGYSTCLVHNVRNSIILFDPQGWFRELQKKTESPYPKVLRDNIIKKNFPMLSGKLNGSFDEQIRTAIQRNDIISINHRVSAFLASYFDILFAINGLMHPGEKKLVLYALANCAILPSAFPQGPETLCLCPPPSKPDILNDLVQGIREIIDTAE